MDWGETVLQAGFGNTGRVWSCGVNTIQFKIICIALFTVQSLQSSFPGN